MLNDWQSSEPEKAADDTTESVNIAVNDVTADISGVQPISHSSQEEMEQEPSR